jgi:hypothetical protein
MSSASGSGGGAWVSTPERAVMVSFSCGCGTSKW